MMQRFDKFIKIILANEGGVSDKANDKGGLTKYGISQKAYPHIDIRNLTINEAELIYKQDYYLPCKIDSFQNELLALHIFDMALNSGCKRAIKLLQQTLCISADGIVGKDTINTANSKDYSNEYISTRNNYYKIISLGRNREFLKGWLNRVINTTNAL